MLLITYGMPRSASTFVWQLTYDLINYTNKQHKLKDFLLPHQRPNFIYNVSDEIKSMSMAIPSEAYYLIKTHGEYDDSLREYESDGSLKVICSIRNPYDLCVSWMDVHRKEKNMEDKREGFSEADSLDKVTEVVLRDIEIAQSWMQAENPLIFRYPDILGDHARLIHKIVDHIGLETYLFDKVYNFYLEKGNITEYNVGIEGRGEELKSSLSVNVRDKFDKFIVQYLS